MKPLNTHAAKHSEPVVWIRDVTSVPSELRIRRVAPHHIVAQAIGRAAVIIQKAVIRILARYMRVGMWRLLIPVLACTSGCGDILRAAIVTHIITLDRIVRALMEIVLLNRRAVDHKCVAWVIEVRPPSILYVVLAIEGQIKSNMLLAPMPIRAVCCSTAAK